MPDSSNYKVIADMLKTEPFIPFKISVFKIYNFEYKISINDFDDNVNFLTQSTTKQ